MLEPQLRRLRIEEKGFSRRLGRRGSFKSDRIHPYRHVQEPRDGPKFRICIDGPSFGDSSVLPRALGLLAALPEEHFEVFRTPGIVGDPWSDVPEFDLRNEAGLVHVVLKAFDHEVRTGVPYPDQWFAVAGHLLGDRAAGDQLIAVKAAEALGAHLFVTASPQLVAARGQFPTATGIFTPAEVLPILWSWMRGFGDYWDQHIVTDASLSYWALARALTPHARDGFIALALTGGPGGGGRDPESMAQSVLVRLSRTIADVDELYRTWHLPTDNDTVDTIARLFDQIVLQVAAVLDNLALLVVDHFSLSGLRPYEITLSSSRLVSKLKSNTDARALAIGAFVEANRARLTFHTELRHHAIHRENLAGIRYARQHEPEEARIQIFEPTLSKVWDGLVAWAENPADWGLSHRRGPHKSTVSFVDQPGRQETVDSPGEALLDPLPFALRLIAATARVVDQVFARLDFAADPSISEEQRRRINAFRGTAEWPFRDVDRDSLIMTSPLAFLPRALLDPVPQSASEIFVRPES